MGCDRRPLANRLSAQPPTDADGDILIPKTIHYCWFGKEPQSELLLRCMDSWQRLLPGWPIKRWDESNSPLDNGYARAALSGGHWSRLSNFVRLHAMHEGGGVYLDTDVEVIRDMTPLLDNECFLGFQLKSENEDWVNHAVMGSRAGHWFPESCIRRTLELFEQTGTLHRGPAVATSVLRNAGLRVYGLQDLAGVRLYPTDYFYPYSWLETFSPACLTENTYSIHHWARSWLEQ